MVQSRVHVCMCLCVHAHTFVFDEGGMQGIAQSLTHVKSCCGEESTDQACRLRIMRFTLMVLKELKPVTQAHQLRQQSKNHNSENAMSVSICKTVITHMKYN